MARRPEIRTRDPSVIVDVLHEDGLLYFVIENISAKPARLVRIRFNKPVQGWDGTCEVSALRIFERLDFLAPGKAIRVYIDRVGRYFATRQPQLLIVNVSYEDHEGTRQIANIRHDM